MYGVSPETSLKDLKSTYRGLMKDWHPDKFSNNPEGLAEAEIKSREAIDAYHFLVSMAPETIEAGKEAYKETISSHQVENFAYSKMALEVFFTNGHSYEYFGVKEGLYEKLCNAPGQARFCKRHIFNAFPYRKTKKKKAEDE